MAVETNHINSKDNPPVGEGWVWHNYGECWFREYDGRKRRKKTTTKKRTAKKKPTRKKSTSETKKKKQPKELSVKGMLLGSLIISFLLLLSKLFID